MCVSVPMCPVSMVCSGNLGLSIIFGLHVYKFGPAFYFTRILERSISFMFIVLFFSYSSDIKCICKSNSISS